MLLMTVRLMEMPVPDCLCFFFPCLHPRFLFFSLKAKGNGQIVLPGEQRKQLVQFGTGSGGSMTSAWNERVGG